VLGWRICRDELRELVATAAAGRARLASRPKSSCWSPSSETATLSEGPELEPRQLAGDLGPARAAARLADHGGDDLGAPGARVGRRPRRWPRRPQHGRSGARSIESADPHLHGFDAAVHSHIDDLFELA